MTFYDFGDPALRALLTQKTALPSQTANSSTLTRAKITDPARVLRSALQVAPL